MTANPALTLSGLETWLYQTLSTDPALSGMLRGVHLGAVPAEEFFNDYPCLLVTYHQGADLNGLGLRRLQVQADYVVRAVGVGESSLTLAAIASRADQLLHGAQAALETERLVCRRIRPFQMLELHAGSQIRHLGGIYAFVVS